ncbi:hypothetical protein R8Z50_11375 [Longispora sp. K20-0274]
MEHGWRVLDCPAGNCYAESPHILAVEIGAYPSAGPVCGMWNTMT